MFNDKSFGIKEVKEAQEKVNAAVQKLVPLYEANSKAIEAWSLAVANRAQESSKATLEHLNKARDLKPTSPEDVASWALRFNTQAFSDVLAYAWINYEHGKKFADLQKSHTEGLVGELKKAKA